MTDLYSRKLPRDVLKRLFTQVSQDAKLLSDKGSYFLPGVCAGGEVIPLAAMNPIYPLVFLLQLVLNE
jgi:hypothetical protein